MNLDFIKQMTKIRRPLVIGALVLALYFILDILNFTTIPRLKTNDLYLNLKYILSKKPSYLNKFLIVSIGDTENELMGGKWPWDRNVFASIVYKLNRYRPAVIGFDLGFIGESPGFKESDFLLAEAFKDAGNIILSSYFDTYGRYVMPLEVLRSSALGHGFTNKPLDKDNVVRRTKIFERDNISNKIIDYSFDFNVFCAFNHTIPEDAIAALGKDNLRDSIIINFSAKTSDFTTVSFSDVLNDKINPSLIENRIVLIGTTAEIFHDIYPSSFGRMPSVYIIANTILMLFNKTFIYEVPAFINLILLISITILMSILISRISASRGGIIVVGILVISSGINILLLLNNILLDTFSLTIVLPIVYLANLLVGYIDIFQQSSRIKKMVMIDPLTDLSTRRYFLYKLEADLKRETPLTLVLFNIDNFEIILNELGLDKANLIIKEIGDLITGLSRKTRGVDFVSRYGEAKFFVLLHNTSLKGASVYSERIITNIGEKIASVPSPIISAGIADKTDIPYNSSKIFVKCAECALQRATRNAIKICVYDPKIDRISPEEYIKGKEISEADLSYVAEELEDKNKELALLLNNIRILQKDVISSEKLAAAGKLAATIYHDLNKPIVNLRSGLKIIKEELDKMPLKEGSDIKTFINFSTEEAKRLEKLCYSLRDLYSPVEKELKEASINSIIDELLGLSFAQLIKKQVRLIKKMPPDLPPVIANTTDLKQVFLNIIMNAIESMQNNGELEIKTSKSENMIEVAIKDTGCGIPPENIDKLFKPFFTTKKAEEGSGLGLYASLEIVKKYGGTIKVDSEVNKGSTFKIFLPFKHR